MLTIVSHLVLELCVRQALVSNPELRYGLFLVLELWLFWPQSKQIATHSPIYGIGLSLPVVVVLAMCFFLSFIVSTLCHLTLAPITSVCRSSSATVPSSAIISLYLAFMSKALFATLMHCYLSFLSRISFDQQSILASLIWLCNFCFPLQSFLTLCLSSLHSFFFQHLFNLAQQGQFTPAAGTYCCGDIQGLSIEIHIILTEAQLLAWGYPRAANWGQITPGNCCGGGISRVEFWPVSWCRS